MSREPKNQLPLTPADTTLAKYTRLENGTYLL
jgi:hypothetical protein